jgi:hypothetical protein
MQQALYSSCPSPPLSYLHLNGRERFDLTVPLVSALFIEALLTDALSLVAGRLEAPLPSVSSVLSALRASRMHRGPQLAESLRRTRAAVTTTAGRLDADARAIQAVSLLRFLSDSSSPSYRNEVSDCVIDASPPKAVFLSAVGRVLDQALALRGFTSALRGKKVRNIDSISHE